MGEEASQTFEDMNLKKMGSNEAWCSKLMIMEGGKNNNEICDSISIESSFEENSSENSISSISPSDLVEDASSSATSSSSSSSSSSSNGPLYELSELMAQLPIRRRGLSKHYQGKSQSFTSLASVRSVEDLPKKVIPLYKRTKMKSCKSYGWGLDGHNHHNNNKSSYSPKATISKKAGAGAGSRSCFMSSIGD